MICTGEDNGDKSKADFFHIWQCKEKVLPIFSMAPIISQLCWVYKHHCLYQMNHKNPKI